MLASALERPALSPAEAADILGVTRQTIHNLINRGELRRFKIGTCTRIPTADVLALVGGPGALTVTRTLRDSVLIEE